MERHTYIGGGSKYRQVESRFFQTGLGRLRATVGSVRLWRPKLWKWSCFGCGDIYRRESWFKQSTHMDTYSLGYIFGQYADNHKMQAKNSDCRVAFMLFCCSISIIHISISSNKKPFVSVLLILLYALKLVYYQLGMLWLIEPWSLSADIQWSAGDLKKERWSDVARLDSLSSYEIQSLSL